MTISEISAKFQISPEQFSKATHCESNGQHFYIVESASEPSKEYHVKFNRQYGVLQCSCPAVGKCWHMRAALAANEHYKATELARRQREQIEVERSEAYRLERAMFELETLQAELKVLQAVC